MPIRLQLLGGLRAWRDDVPLSWVSAHHTSSALLVYLALESGVTREQLARMFWPDEEVESARHALRQALYRLRHAAGEAIVEDAGDVLQLNAPVVCDGVEFERAVDGGDFAGALALYRGSFLKDVSLSASREFDAWTDQQRARFGRLHRRACRARIEGLVHVGAVADAIEAARAWVTLEPYDDEAQHRLIELLAGSGQRAEALAQYEQYERLLKAEELEPLDETKALVALLRAGEVGVSALAPALPPPVGFPGPVVVEPQVPLRRRRRRMWAAGAVLLVAALSLAAWFGVFRQPPAGPAPRVRTFSGMPGTELRPAFSPDGRQLAFAWNGEKQDNSDIYVQLVDEPTPQRLTFDAAVDYNPVWSPDGHHIAFLRDTRAGTEVIRIRAAGGGVEQKLHVSPVRSWWPVCGLAWSPNGNFLAIVERDSVKAPASIFLLNIETREKQRLTTPPADSWDGLPAFSPDGGSLAFIRGHDRPLSDIHVLRISDGGQARGEPLRVTGNETFIHGLDWTADGRSIVFSSTSGGVWTLWRVSASGGEPERLPVGGNNAFWPSVSRKGDRLAYAEGIVSDNNIWRVAAPGGGATDDPATDTLRISPSPQHDQDPAFSPDGRTIVWSTMHSGSHQLWLSNSDGTQPHQLTAPDHEPPGAAEPRWSPDGKQIAFNGYSRSARHVKVISVDGGKPQRLTSGDFDEDVFGWSHDGRWVYFGSNRGKGDAIWKAKVPASGGSPILVARNGWGAVESLDGRFVYYSGAKASIWHDGGSEESIWKVSVSGASPVRLAPNAWGPVESFDGKFVYYNGPEHSIWRVAAVGGEPALVRKTGQRALWTLASTGIFILDPEAEGGPTIELFSFSHPRIQAVRLPGNPDSYLAYPTGVSVSTDGRWILYMRVDRAEADIMLVDNFR